MKEWMERTLWVVGLLLLGVVLALSSPDGTWAGNTPGTGIVNSPHDLSGKAWNTTGQICKVCHTPHGANTGASGAPLWNRRLTAATFNVYSSSTLNATVGQPDGVSKLCLSCHDGTVGLESFVSSTPSNLDVWVDPAVGTNMIVANRNVGTNLTNDHPISFTYDAALATADGGLVTPNSASWVDAGKKVPLYSGKLQCASCHDVHNSAGQVAVAPLLRVTQVASALCTTCHVK